MENNLIFTVGLQHFFQYITLANKTDIKLN